MRAAGAPGTGHNRYDDPEPVVVPVARGPQVTERTDSGWVVRRTDLMEGRATLVELIDPDGFKASESLVWR